MLIKKTYTEDEALRMARALDTICTYTLISKQIRLHGRVFLDELTPICDESLLKSIVDFVRESRSKECP